jgi:hypothetical protein
MDFFISDNHLINIHNGEGLHTRNRKNKKVIMAGNAIKQS